jgi:phospholipid-transporting ATPase
LCQYANLRKYVFENVFSGEVIYESWTLSFYNVFYTVLPPLALGILDQFVSARLLDRYPQLYGLGQKNRFFRISVFASWIVTAIYHSIILYVGGSAFYIYDGVQRDSVPAGKWVWGSAMYGAALLTVLGKAALVTNNWTKYHVIAIPGSMAIWVAVTVGYGIVAPKLNISTELFETVPRLFSSPSFWLQMPTLAILCLARDFTWKFSKRLWRPEAYHHVQEIQKYNIQDYRPRYVLFPFPFSFFALATDKIYHSMEQFQKAIRKVRQVQRMRKQRGYAFSQADESQTRVLQAYDTTQHRGRYGEMASSRPQ